MRVKVSFLWQYSSIVTVIAVIILNIAIATELRTWDVKSLKNKYLVGYDPYNYLREARMVVEDGRIPERDYMRHVPEGVDMTQRLVGNSYAIAFFYKFLHLFSSSITLEQTAIYYPVICFALILIIFFLLVYRLFNWSMALLAVTILAVVPALVPRTIAGFADRDALSLLESLLAFYFYLWANQTLNARKRVLLALVSGFFTGLLALTWPGAGLLMGVVVFFNIAKLLLDYYSRREMYIYLCWYLPAIFMTLLFALGQYHNFFQPFAFSVVLLPTLFAIASISTVLIAQKELLKRRLTFSYRLPIGLVMMSAILILFVSLSFVVVPPKAEKSITTTVNKFFFPAGSGEVAKNIAEFHPTPIREWLKNHKWLFFLFIIGATLLVRQLALFYSLNWQIVTNSFAVMLGGVIFSNLSSNSPLNGDTVIAHAVYLGGVFLFLITVYSLYLRNWHNKKEQKIKTNANEYPLFLFVWFALMLFYARNASRFTFYLAPIAVILSSYAIVTFLEKLTKGKKEVTSKLTIYLVLSILCWEIFAIDSNIINFSIKEFSLSTIKFSLMPRINFYLTLAFIILLTVAGSRLLVRNIEKQKIVRTFWGWIAMLFFLIAMIGGFPYFTKGYVKLRHASDKMSSEWIETLEWMKSETQEDAVIAAWWDWGSRILACANRATIIDQQHDYNWIHLAARHLFLGQSEKEALKFLKAHRATHLLITPKEVWNILEIISAIGSDEKFDYRKSIRTFIHDKSLSSHSNGLSTLCFIPGESVKRVENSTVFSISEIYVEFNHESNETYFKNAILIANISGNKVKRPPRRIYFEGKGYTQEGDTLPLTVIVDPVSPKALCIDEIVYNSLIVQLYLLGKNSENFEQVYPIAVKDKSTDSSNNTDTSIKIWKINYPEGISTN